MDCNLFSEATAAYARAFPTIAQQNLQNFSNAMQLDDDNRDTRATIGNSGFAGDVTFQVTLKGM